MLRFIFAKLFKISDLIIGKTSGVVFCTLLNLRSKIIRSKVNVQKVGDFYQAKDLNHFYPKRFFKAEKQGVMAYGKGFQARVDDLKRCYFLDFIDFSDGDKVIDCGANVGDIELFFLKKGLNIKYVGFEPSPDEFSCLKKNVNSNNLFNIGLWDKNETLEFYVSSQNADSSLIEPLEYDNKISLRVEVLSKYIDENIKCLKLEAEGAEPEILKGLGKKLSNIEYITADVGFERGTRAASTLPDVSNILIKNNFEMLFIGRQRLCALFRNKNFV